MSQEPLAHVRVCCGRWCLFVRDRVLGMEGDKCRDDYIGWRSPIWTEESLKEAAKVINEGMPLTERVIPASRIRELMEKLTKREEEYRKRELWDMANRCEAQANVLNLLLKEGA